MTLSETEIERYARHIVLREIGGKGQKALKAARVAVIGAGGLGSPALLYLAAAGIGTLRVIDDDAVSLSNLQRQILHGTAQIGQPKAQSAAKALGAINPHVTIEPIEEKIQATNAEALLSEIDLVLDGCDSFETRSVVNAACVSLKIPLISGAISQWEGQISLFDPARGGPCYACLFPEEPAAGLAPSCAEAGVVGALPGIVGAMMAAEAIKRIVGIGAELRGAMQVVDVLWGENRRIATKADPCCRICGQAR